MAHACQDKRQDSILRFSGGGCPFFAEKEINQTDFFYSGNTGNDQIYRDEQNTANRDESEQEKYPVNDSFIGFGISVANPSQ